MSILENILKSILESHVIFVFVLGLPITAAAAGFQIKPRRDTCHFNYLLPNGDTTFSVSVTN